MRGRCVPACRRWGEADGRPSRLVERCMHRSGGPHAAARTTCRPGQPLDHMPSGTSPAVGRERGSRWGARGRGQIRVGLRVGVRRGVAWCGVVWCGVVQWCGVGWWCGVVWWCARVGMWVSGGLGCGMARRRAASLAMETEGLGGPACASPCAVRRLRPAGRVRRVAIPKRFRFTLTWLARERGATPPKPASGLGGDRRRASWSGRRYFARMEEERGGRGGMVCGVVCGAEQAR